MGSYRSTCPVCGEGEISIRHVDSEDVYKVECPACGDYVITGENLDRGNLCDSRFTPMARAAFAHRLRRRRNLSSWVNTAFPFVTVQAVEDFFASGARLPERDVQLDNLIKYFGDLEAAHGQIPVEVDLCIWAQVGCLNQKALADLVKDGIAEGYIWDQAVVEVIDFGEDSSVTLSDVRLTLAGCRRWRELKLGTAKSRDGFIAMQFGDPRLDSFVRDVIQAGVRSELGVELHRVDSPDKIEAGVIDNIMREAIEDAAFVLVELSHGNRGAYWEAGLAEGLRKPVIYLCEKSVWDDRDHPNRPHFDVKHRTTIMWDESETDSFKKTLIATIKNSLRERAG